MEREERIALLEGQAAGLRAQIDALLPANLLEQWLSCREAVKRLRIQGAAPDPPLIGLPNQSNYCFLNSAVQCLRHTPQLTDAIIGAVPEGDTDSQGLLQSFAELLRTMDASTIADDPAVQPAWTNFVQQCNQLPPPMAGDPPLVVAPPHHQQQQDVGEFLGQLIDALSTAKDADGQVMLSRAGSVMLSRGSSLTQLEIDSRERKLNTAVTSAYSAEDHTAVHAHLEAFAQHQWEASTDTTRRTHIGALFQGQQLTLQRCEAPACGRVSVASADPFLVLPFHISSDIRDTSIDLQVMRASN